MKLASKIILLFTAAVIALTAIFSHFTSRLFVESVRQQHREIAQSLDPFVRDQQFQQAILGNDIVYFHQAMRTITDRHTRIRWIWNATGSLQRPDPTVKDAPFRSTTQQAEDGSVSLITHRPMQCGDRNGAVEICSPLASASDHARQSWIHSLLLIGGIGLLAIGIILIAGVQLIARPLDRINEKMKRIGEGDFASDLVIPTHDELGELAISVNRTCDRLREQTEQLQQETIQRLETVEQLRHADRLKTVGQLAAGLAHEVGTPLNVVVGRASLLMTEDLSRDEVHENAKAIKQESERISDIVRKLLDFARRGESRKTEADLRAVIQQATDLMRPLASAREIEVKLEMPDSVTPARFDFNQIQQVIMNLVDNAIDASGDHSEVTVSLRHDEGHWVLTVSDSGSGIDPSDQPKIFEPFFTTKPVGEGTGLGLAIVHGIVADHDGSVEFESQPGGGTTITIRLPATAS